MPLEAAHHELHDRNDGQGKSAEFTQDLPEVLSEVYTLTLLESVRLMNGQNGVIVA